MRKIEWKDGCVNVLELNLKRLKESECYLDEFLYYIIIYLYRKLKRLNIGGNELTAVPQKALALLENLKKLEMQENRITSISEGDFAGSYPNKNAILTPRFCNMSIF